MFSFVSVRLQKLLGPRAWLSPRPRARARARTRSRTITRSRLDG